MQNTVKQFDALSNAVNSLGLIGFSVHIFQVADGRKKPKFLLTDNMGNSITGTWNYDKLNHFILGYGKAFQKSAALALVEEKGETK